MLASNHTQIANAPTNNSTAKSQFSFPKAKRFPEQSSATGKFYDIPPALNKRSASFGYGKKYDFTTEKEKTPDPGAYQAPLKIQPGGGFSFGLSRENCKTIFQGHFVADPKVPGPGTYSITPKFSNEGRKITLAGKRHLAKARDPVPGPGAYDQVLATSPGKFVLSTVRNLEVHTFSPRTSPRFQGLEKRQNPAPGSYNVDKGFMNYSKYLSTCKSSGSIAFGLTSRDFNYGIVNTPGPGSYRMPSEFGYYEVPHSRSQAVSIGSLQSKKTNSNS